MEFFEILKGKCAKLEAANNLHELYEEMKAQSTADKKASLEEKIKNFNSMPF